MSGAHGSSTRRTKALRTPRRPALILTVVGISLVTVIAALIWGSALKRQSDAYHAASEADAWTVGEPDIPPLPVTVPDIRAKGIAPRGSVSGLTGDGYNAAVIILSADAEGRFPYVTPLAVSQGIPTAEDAPTLTEEVQRMKHAGLYVSCVFCVTCLDASVLSDPALAALRRGTELAILTDVAACGVDDLLLVGLPYGDDTSDARTVGFLRDFKSALGQLTHQPAVGVALLPDGFTVRNDADSTDNAAKEPSSVSDKDGTIYAGSLTPGRMLTVCDYLALDLREAVFADASVGLKAFRYAYNRFSLRLLVSDPSLCKAAEAHGMTRTVLITDGE